MGWDRKFPWCWDLLGWIGYKGTRIVVGRNTEDQDEERMGWMERVEVDTGGNE